VASSKFNISRTINDSFLGGVITRHIRGNVVNINIGGAVSLPNNQITTIQTFTDYKPSYSAYAVASAGGNNNAYVLFALQSNGNLVAYNYSGSVINYLYGSLTFCI